MSLLTFNEYAILLVLKQGGTATPAEIESRLPGWTGFQIANAQNPLKRLGKAGYVLKGAGGSTTLLESGESGAFGFVEDTLIKLMAVTVKAGLLEGERPRSSFDLSEQRYGLLLMLALNGPMFMHDLASKIYNTTGIYFGQNGVYKAQRVLLTEGLLSPIKTEATKGVYPQTPYRITNIGREAASGYAFKLAKLYATSVAVQWILTPG